jgi:hypothetical protein
MNTDRRSFVARAAGLSAAAFIGTSAQAEARETVAAPWDLSWADALTGKHKQVFDYGSMDMSDRDLAAGDSPLRIVRNWLNAHKEVYNLEPPYVNTVVGVAYDAFPMNVNDATWQKYSLGERWKLKDSTTGTWAVRNLLSNPSEKITDRSFSLEALRQRGTIFWQCNNALGGAAATLAAAMKMDAAVVRQELIDGFVPGVKLVPAHTFMLGLVQERGFTYEKV